MNVDLHTAIAIRHVLAPQTCGTTGIGKTGKVIDRTLGGTNGFRGIEFEFSYGAIAATNATMTQTIYECTSTGVTTTAAAASAMTTVAATGILGLNAGIGATSSRVSGTSENTVKRTGYIGIHRFVTAKIVPKATAAALVGINCILGSPDIQPTAT